MTLNKNIFRLIGYLAFSLFCLGIPWFLFCIFLQKFSFEVWDEKSEYIENIGYLGSFIGGTLGVLLTAGSLIFLAKTLSFERRKSDQENFDNKFFLMLERLESIKDKIDEKIKKKILNEIDDVSEFSIEKTLKESKKIIHKYNSDIGHYYRMLYQILKMVDQNKDRISDFQNAEINYYTNILRSTLDFRLTQILAINTYYSENFDIEYEKYALYVKKYNFFEHMPFCINSRNISQSLLAVYINCPEGFGENSFLKKMNKYILNSIQSSIKCGYDYDLTYSYLKRISGGWSCDKELGFNVNLKERKLIIKFFEEKISMDLLIILPDSEKFVKCTLFNRNPYSIHSYFDESLNFIIKYEDNLQDFECSNSDLNDMKEIKFIFTSSYSNSLNLEVICEHITHDYPIHLNEQMFRLKSSEDD